MTILHAIYFGLVEGITEFLPISSTAHLLLLSDLLSLEQTEFLKSFEIAIQLGAILAVVALYARYLLQNRSVIGKIAVAFLPTGIIGFALYRIIKGFLFEETGIVLWSLLVGGVILILFELFFRRPAKTLALEDVSFRQAFGIGLFQSLAVVPGVSRAAATIIGGRILRLSRETVVAFSFLLAVPTMLAATGYDLLRSAPAWSSQEFGLLAVGFAFSFATALLAIRFLLRFVRKNTFIVFGAYRILLALLFLLLLS